MARSGPPIASRLVLLGLATLVLCGVTILWQVEPHDEGLMLAWAGRLANGQAPYRDFWCNYPPGQPLLLAGLVKLFGPSLLAWRVLRLGVDVAVALLVYGLVRRRAGEGWALAGWLAAAGAMAFPAGPGPNATALALGLGALLAAPVRPGLAGCLAGAAVVFRPEVGVAIALGAALQSRGRRMWLTLGVAAAVAVAGLLPFFVVAPSQMADQVVGFLGIQHLQRLPLPLDPHTTDPNKIFERLFPTILLAVAAVAVVWTLVRRRWHPAIALAIVGALYLIGRPDDFHLIPLSVAAAVLLCTAAAREPQRAIRVALVLCAGVIAAWGVERRAGQLLHPPAQAAVPGPAADGVRTDPADARALAALRAAVDRAAPPGGPVFVADPRHDRVTAGDPLLYTILDRRNPTRYDVMQPGVVTKASVQREIVRDLARTDVVVRWLDPRATHREPNGSARSSGVHVLDRYLAARFAPRGRFGVYELLVRR
jgi:hypothetical protein